MSATEQRQNIEKTWYQTKGDRRTAIAATLRKHDGSLVDLTGCTVAFLMILASDNTVKIDEAAATIDDADAGQVSYAWTANDVNTAGEYYAWWVVTRTSDSKKDHYPPEGKRFKVHVVESY